MQILLPAMGWASIIAQEPIFWYTLHMSKSQAEQFASIGPAKALAMGCYGEDLAAYCYVQLSEKAERECDRKEFKAMVAEEQTHRAWLQALLDKHYPGSDFVLTPDEKQMVESGSRFLNITNRAAFEDAVRRVVVSEEKTAHFYREMAPHIDQAEVKRMYEELAKEGVEHHRRLLQIAAENDISVP